MVFINYLAVAPCPLQQLNLKELQRAGIVGRNDTLIYKLYSCIGIVHRNHAGQQSERLGVARILLKRCVQFCSGCLQVALGRKDPRS